MPESKYKKCSRCELNYISKEEQYCDVCKADLKLAPSPFIDEIEDEEIDGVLCPVCKLNYISFDESVCAVCREKSEKEDVFDEEDDETWRTYLDDEKEEILPVIDEIEVSLSELEEEEMEDGDEDADEFDDDIEDLDDIIDDFEDDDDFEDEDDDEDE